VQAVAGIVGFALVAIACFVSMQPAGPSVMESAAEKALKYASPLPFVDSTQNDRVSLCVLPLCFSALVCNPMYCLSLDEIVKKEYNSEEGAQ
jgi:hypothetical protein